MLDSIIKLEVNGFTPEELTTLIDEEFPDIAGTIVPGYQQYNKLKTFTIDTNYTEYHSSNDISTAIMQYGHEYAHRYGNVVLLLALWDETVRIYGLLKIKDGISMDYPGRELPKLDIWL